MAVVRTLLSLKNAREVHPETRIMEEKEGVETGEVVQYVIRYHHSA